ncbi:lysozyme inhibitor LprI family protein [Enterobacillus tribolii]|uniref:Uncharacterized protein DUF1311 n=1 Tax=Enterobacillus tribolii TaxID=1487935 RepID=A0A370QGE0_9GAMM|nr:lysozyme inhibitor LprI family protein [Enterobacillus tribolii]MBW7981741.1 DUF1311 domain-containing protein [Enterobacillus tribolii]RDK87425.1 uncharacterized protein DUF1311 [Enterobacillus tribolii]
MKNGNLLFLLALLFNYAEIAHADIYYDYLNRNKSGLCNEIVKGKSYMETYQCTSLMLKDSKQKIESKAKEVKLELGKMYKPKKKIAIFNNAQNAWVEYVEKQCAYKLIGYEGNTPLYQSTKDLCFAVENYRRLDVLAGEPSIP